MHASTVYGVLKRAGLSVLARLDRTTRLVVRYERERPGELIHFDVKKFGKVPDGDGKRFDARWKESGAITSAAPWAQPYPARPLSCAPPKLPRAMANCWRPARTLPLARR